MADNLIGVDAPNALDLEKVKREGLGIDFEKLKKTGARGLSEEDRYRLKTYGFCAQKHPGYFMLRHRIPGGFLTSEQLSGLAELCEVYGRNQAHITARQNLEFHWVRVEDALDIFNKLREIGLVTRSSCGHTMRNVVACPHGAVAPEGLQNVLPWAARVSDYYVAQSDLLNPVMPNRLNVYFSACHQCNPDAVLNDIAFIAVSRENVPPTAASFEQEVGFELWAGGSLGTNPMLAIKVRDFIPLADSLPACMAIFEIYAKHGEREKGKSRLKFLIKQWGREKFVAMFDALFLEKKSLSDNQRFSIPEIAKNGNRPSGFKQVLASLLPVPSLRTGFFYQRQRGYVRLVVDVPMGEIRSNQLADVGKIAKRFGNGDVYFTKHQNLELHWIKAFQMKRVMKAFHRIKLYPQGQINTVKILACPGSEFCPLAVTNTFGAARDILKSFKADHSEKAKLLGSISIHISGCSNSCTRYQVGEIGLMGTLMVVGDMQWHAYRLFLGGKTSGGVQLGEMVYEGITDKMIVPAIDALLAVVMESRQHGETFQAVVNRVTPKKIAELISPKLAPYLPEASHAVKMVLNLA